MPFHDVYKLTSVDEPNAISPCLVPQNLISALNGSIQGSMPVNFPHPGHFGASPRLTGLAFEKSVDESVSVFLIPSNT